MEMTSPVDDEVQINRMTCMLASSFLAPFPVAGQNQNCPHLRNCQRPPSAPHCPTNRIEATSAQHALSRRLLLRGASSTLLAGIFPLLQPSAAASRGLREGEAAEVLRDVQWPASWPYAASDFVRFDESPDEAFYASARLVRHIDGQAVAALKAYYLSLLPAAHRVLDVCASIEAYLPNSWPGRLVTVGLGMSMDEMRRNPALTEAVVRDLNLVPRLPYGDGSFDLVTCNLSVDYLTKPREVLAEVARVLRRGGTLAVSFSDRVFATKAVALWMAGADADHIYTVASYLHFADDFSEPNVIDLSPRKNGRCTGDPLYVLQAIRL